MKQYIIAIDQSTSSTKALLFDEQCHMIGRTNVDHHQYYPQTGWVEHDAEEIYQNMVEAIRKLMESSHLSPLTSHWQSQTSVRRQWYGTNRQVRPLPMQWYGRTPVVPNCAVSYGSWDIPGR